MYLAVLEEEELTDKGKGKFQTMLKEDDETEKQLTEDKGSETWLAVLIEALIEDKDSEMWLAARKGEPTEDKGKEMT